MKIFNKIYLIVTIISILICGCSIDKQTFYEENSTESTEAPIQTESFNSVQSPTEESTIATEPNLQLDKEAGAHQLRFESENGEEYMDYYLFVPNNPQKNMPIIVFLHGAVEIGKVELLQDYGIVSVTKELYGDDFPFLLLLPCTHYPSWTAGNVPGTLKALIESVSSEYETDPERITITGHSLGAVGTWKMVSLYADFFSAAVPISCGIDEMLNYENCARVPISAFAGTVGNDEKNYNPAMHVLVERINDAGGNAMMNTIEGADHDDMVTAPYTVELFEWMLDQQ